MPLYTNTNLGTLCQVIADYFAGSPDVHFAWVEKDTLAQVFTYEAGAPRVLASVDFSREYAHCDLCGTPHPLAHLEPGESADGEILMCEVCLMRSVPDSAF